MANLVNNSYIDTQRIIWELKESRDFWKQMFYRMCVLAIGAIAACVWICVEAIV